MSSFIDQNGVKRCFDTKLTNKPHSCTIIFSKNNVMGLIFSGSPKIIHLDKTECNPLTIRITR